MEDDSTVYKLVGPVLVKQESRAPAAFPGWHSRVKAHGWQQSTAVSIPPYSFCSKIPRVQLRARQNQVPARQLWRRMVIHTRKRLLLERPFPACGGRDTTTRWSSFPCICFVVGLSTGVFLVTNPPVSRITKLTTKTRTTHFTT